MPLFQKPQFNSVWAATGTKLTPPTGKISQGWVVEIPPHEYENWSQNRQDALLAHLNQVGIPMWDATVEYQAGKSYVQGSTSGVVYRAATTNTNINPEIDIQSNWTVAFQATGEALLRNQNLSDVPNKALARSNLGIPDTVFYDGRYLIKAENFGDVPNKATARTNLEVYSRQEVLDLLNTYTPAGEISGFARSTPPNGWLVCDGSTISRTTYARLFEAIGTTFGAGNGSTTFRLPDLRGEFIRGWDAGRGVDAGRSFASWQDSDNKIHSHTVNDPGHAHNVNHRANGATTNTQLDDVLKTLPGSATTTTTTSATGISLSSTGGSESRPRNVALLYCIRT